MPRVYAYMLLRLCTCEFVCMLAILLSMQSNVLSCANVVAGEHAQSMHTTVTDRIYDACTHKGKPETRVI